MKDKQILFGKNALNKLHNGTELSAKVVGSTLGPRGRNVALDLEHSIDIIHDGIKIFQQVQLEDKVENLGVRVLREASQRVVESVGDGTSVTTILSHEIFSELRQMVSAGINPMSLRSDLEQASKEVIKEIGRIKQKVRGVDDLIQVATISAEDEDMGKMVGETLHKIGENGVLTVDEARIGDAYVEHQEGLEFNNGWVDARFVTNPDRMESTIENPHIVITDLEIDDVSSLATFLGKIGQANIRNLVIIAADVRGMAFASLLVNKLNGQANINIIKPPVMGIQDKLFLEDIAILTGGKFISKEIYKDISEIEVSDLGIAERVTSTKKATQIIGGRGDKKNIKARVESLKSQLKNHDGTELEAEKLKERIAKLSNGVAVLHVGGATEIEAKERRERALDSVLATKAAMREGIVPGGEIVYLTARKVLEDKLDNFAYRVLYNALEKPFKKLLENAGMDSGKALAQLDHAKDIYYGFDVTDGKMKNMIKKGIVDPASVSQEAIKNAVSVSIALATTGSVIVPIKEVLKDGRE